MDEKEKHMATEVYQAKLEAHKDTQITAEQQTQLNAPKQVEGGLKPEDEDYLEQIMSMVRNKEIDLAVPSSLLNESVYEELEASQKSKIEMNARSILHTLRLVRELYESADYATDSHEMAGMLAQMRQMVERVESVNGDVLKI